MTPRRARTAIFALACAACARPEAAGPSAAKPDAGAATVEASTTALAPDDAAVDAAKLGAIGAEGGTVESAGARLVVPPGALAEARTFTIERISGDALAEWPRGTVLGFVFAPAEEGFRVPATIELPHVEDEGEVMCQERTSERQHVQFDATPASSPFRFHVAELPLRCAVYSAAHARARKAAAAREASEVHVGNAHHKWEMKGKTCDPHELVRPNAGKDLREPPGVGGCPAGMAPIPNRPAACVDRWEAHLVEVLEDGTEHTWSPYFNPGALRVRAKSAPGAVPQGYISAVQAQVACAAAGKRLCQDDEWVAACRGAKGTRFPYGDEERRGTCNDHRDQHPAMQYLESHDLSVFTKLEHPCINQVPDSLLPTGTKKSCMNSEQAFDMVGNLHEWTGDPKGHFRGGYYVDTWLNGHGCDYLTTAHEARYWDYSTGFRCCADAIAAPRDR